MNVFASCELFVLVGYSSSIAVDRLFLLNPSTLSYHSIIPTQRRFKNSHVQYWLYFDEANDDCKVVRMETFDVYGADDGWEVQIYSCKTNLWRLIEHKILSEEYHYIYFRPAECVHNNLLYLISHFSDHLRIRCFDIQAEQWRNDILFSRKLRHPELCILDGSLCVLGIDENNKEDVRTGTFCLWILNESGAKESWVKFMSIVPESTRDPRYRPIAYRKGSRHVLLCRSYGSELFWYDLEHKIATGAEFNGLAGYNRIDLICKESLIGFSWWPNELH